MQFVVRALVVVAGCLQMAPDAETVSALRAKPARIGLLGIHLHTADPALILGDWLAWLVSPLASVLTRLRRGVRRFE